MEPRTLVEKAMIHEKLLAYADIVRPSENRPDQLAELKAPLEQDSHKENFPAQSSS